MPSTVGKQVGRKLDRTVGELKRAPRVAVTRAAQAMTTEVRQHIAGATGGDSRLSGVGRKGAKVGAGYKVLSANKAIIQARGPLHLVERTNKDHAVVPKARRVARGGRVAMRMPDGRFRRGPIHVRGSKGKQPFEKGTRAGIPAAAQEIRQAFSAALRRGLKL